MQDIQRLCDLIRQTGYAMHLFLGRGHLEKVYENAYVNRLRKNGIQVEQQHPIKFYDEDGACIGAYFADLFVENCLIVELKVAKAITDEHIAQILGYLRATRIKHGMVINFGAAKYQPRKFVL